MTALRRVPISVLDLALKPAGGTHSDAVHGTVALAAAAERLGYERFWVAEHHGMRAIASSSPPVLIAAIAARTERIRVGSGGVMLPNHAPLVVAEQFGTLRALYGDRIDLGIGRAPGSDQQTSRALRRDRFGADAFPSELMELISYFDDTAPVPAVPGAGDRPQVWLLGSSGYSAQAAGQLGLPFAFAHHFSSENTEAALGMYRSNFRASEYLDSPYAAIAVQVVSDEDVEVVRSQTLPGLLRFIKQRQGQNPEPLSIEEALAHELTQFEELFIEERLQRQAVGTAEQVRAAIAELLDSTAADELIVVPAAAELRYRERTLEIVRELMDAAEH
ncbi:LLM class flavin-dependent oxidoreductase [Ruicaihuangia caeni]|uniref:LLM class flavin-dependent oxidoreductase n=1 Tax=Ruicaihuangia caeni TaxID=3042517 RepID=UPI003390087A